MNSIENKAGDGDLFIVLDGRNKSVHLFIKLSWGLYLQFDYNTMQIYIWCKS